MKNEETKITVGDGSSKAPEEPKKENVENEKTNIEKAEEVLGLERLIKIGNIEQVVDFAGSKIQMHTLKEPEKIQALNLVKAAEGTAIANLELSKIAYLTYSITKIDDECFTTPEKKQQLFAKLHLQAQSIMVELLYDKYNVMSMDQYSIFENFKKK